MLWLRRHWLLPAGALIVLGAATACGHKQQVPSVEVVATRTFVARSEPVTFTAQPSGAKDCQARYAWSISPPGGGGSSGTTLAASFATIGARNVSVTATACGRSATGSRTVWVVAKPCPDGHPFDLISGQTDANGFRLDPEWRWQCDYTPAASAAGAAAYPDPNVYCNHFAWGRRPAVAVGNECSGQIEGTDAPTDPLWSTICHIDTAPPYGVDSDTTVHGHVNLRGSPASDAVTYDGMVQFTGLQDDFPSGFGDGDADLQLTPNSSGAEQTGTRTPPGATPENPAQIHIEFYSGEVLRAFAASPAHRRAWTAALTGLGGSKHALVPAVVIGLFGLDVRHGSYTEVHPIYAVALEDGSGPGFSRWLVFARNGGTEGGCSDSVNHPLSAPQNRITMSLPLPSPLAQLTTDVVYINASFPGSPRMSVTPAGATANLTIQLPPPNQPGVVAGELTIAASAAAARAARPPVTSALTAPAVRVQMPATPQEPEEIARSLAALLPWQRTAALVVRPPAAPTQRLSAREACRRFRPYTGGQAPSQDPLQVHLVAAICKAAGM